MSYLLRRTRKAVWSGDTRSREAAANEFARTDQDTDGLSVFEVGTDDERALVVAAVACERENVGRVDLMELERGELERYGAIAKTPEKGTTPVPGANQLHCSLDWDADTLRRLAEDLYDEGRAPREYGPTAIRDALRSLDPDLVLGPEKQSFVRAQQAKAQTPPGSSRG